MNINRLNILPSKNFSKSSPLKKLIFKIQKKSTINFSKSQVLRTRLFPKKKHYRIIGRSYEMLGIVGTIIKIEYDPYRSSGISLIFFKNKICFYNLSIHNILPGHKIISSLKFSMVSDYIRGNSSILNALPTSISINQIEISKSIGSQYTRSAGCYSVLLRKNELLNYAYISLPSKKIKKVNLYSFATIGNIANISHSDKKLKKAGQNRWLGKKPIVRGVAKNPIDHPHGGGEGKKSKKMVPRTFWGRKLKWKKTSKSKLRFSNL